MKPSRACSRRDLIKGIALAAAVPWPHPCVAASAGAVSQTRPAGAHKILTCNIRKPLLEDETAGNGWEARKAMCAAIILAQRPDIICLQECTAPQIEYLRQRWPEFDCYGLANPEPAFNPANAILFARERYALVSAGGFWLSQQPHVAGTRSWDSARPRFANWVELQDRRSKHVFRVWNTHLDHLGQLAREQQARMIAEAGEPFPAEFPQILTGDFNANAANPAITLLKERGWRDTYSLVHGPTDPGFTFHAFWGPEYDARAGKGRIRGQIDWIFCRGKVTPLAAEIIREGRGGRYPSDHYFVSATVAM